MASTAIKAFIFDWAGTMIDFGCCAPVVALQGAFAEIGLPLTDAEARADMGMAKHAHIASILVRDPIKTAFENSKGRQATSADIDDLFARIEPRMIAAAAEHTTLIEGAAALSKLLRSRGVRVGSGTGYSRSMMDAILREAAAQGYTPERVVCAGDTLEGRPSPLMTWKAMVDLGVWPARTCVKVDDAIVGISEGKEAGTWTIGVAASGNGVGLNYANFCALSSSERTARVTAAAQELLDAGADYVVASVADIPTLLPELVAKIIRGALPGRSPGQIRLGNLR
jgi:phosphonoacetaldehyde hydrolase